MTSTAVYFEDDEDGYIPSKKVIAPNKPHKTSLEVEEIASHSYFMSEFGQYTVPDHVRRGTYGVIEEPQTDSEAEGSSRCGKYQSNRTLSIMSMSEDESSWHNEPLSRDVSIEDLSKSIFDMDENKKVFSKDCYVRRSSFQEEYLTDEGTQEAIHMEDKSHKIYESDITEKLINISKEFGEVENIDRSIGKIAENIKNRLYEELVLNTVNNEENITKHITDTTFERRKPLVSKLGIVEEEVDNNIEELLRRSQRQRSILDDILVQEDERKGNFSIIYETGYQNLFDVIQVK